MYGNKILYRKELSDWYTKQYQTITHRLQKKWFVQNNGKRYEKHRARWKRIRLKYNKVDTANAKKTVIEKIWKQEPTLTLENNTKRNDACITLELICTIGNKRRSIQTTIRKRPSCDKIEFVIELAELGDFYRLVLFGWRRNCLVCTVPWIIKIKICAASRHLSCMDLWYSSCSKS